MKGGLAKDAYKCNLSVDEGSYNWTLEKSAN